jgi:hypothetical protein
MLHITASDRYMLYLNGKYRGRGPARSDPRWQSYDSYDVEPNLKSGENTIAVLAYHYGCQNNYTRDARAGLFVQLEATYPDGREEAFGTDGAWRVRPAEGWSRDVEPINSNVGVTEVYDENLDPLDWMEPGFDDSRWDRAYVVPEKDSPWSYLEARQTPLMREEEIFPVRVVKAGEVMELSRLSTGQVPERLETEPHYPLQYATIRNADALLKADGQTAELKSAPYKPGDPIDKGVRSPYVIVDFGRHVFGFPRVRLEGFKGGVVEMTYGPELIGGRVVAMAGGVRYGDRYVMRPGKQTWQVFEYKQFRYLQIVFRSADKPVSVDSISLVSYNYPAERRGSFECSDPTLTKLWKASVDTTYLQMEDTIVCDAFRERMAWGGDGAHGLYAIWSGYGDIDISDWHFRLLSRGQMADGMLRHAYPGTDDTQAGGKKEPKRATTYDNPLTIPQHALVVAVMLTGDYYGYFGKEKLLSDLYPTLVGLAGWCDRHADETGLIYNLHQWNWVDWGPTDMRGANFETNALYCQFLVNMSQIARDLGMVRDPEVWRSRAEKVKASLRRLHWNPEKGLYVDSLFDGKQSSTITEVANGMALLYGIATDEQTSSIIRKITDQRSEVVGATPLFYYYVLEGLIEAGADEAALEGMRDRHAPMMEASDAPTVWEFWVPYVRERGANIGRQFGNGELASLTHSGGVGPCWTLSKHVLGVYPVGLRFQKCRIQPKTGYLEWARGVFPSVRGDIKVAWKKERDGFILAVTLPDGLETELSLARDASKNLRLTHNGRKFDVQAGTTSASGTELSEERVAIRVKGGSHHVELTPQKS